MQANIRSKKDLEIFLQKLDKPSSYKYGLEQYPTDAALASELLFLAYLDGNIEGRTVADLGAGNGIFSIGAAVMGAARTFAVEIDPGMGSIIGSNAGGLEIRLLEMDVSDFGEKVDTVIMNPPFGAVNERADRIFMQKAVDQSRNIYALHNSKSVDFVRNFYSEHAVITREMKVRIRVPRIYSHHSRDLDFIPAVFFSCKVS